MAAVGVFVVAHAGVVGDWVLWETRRAAKEGCAQPTRADGGGAHVKVAPFVVHGFGEHDDGGFAGAVNRLPGVGNAA